MYASRGLKIASKLLQVGLHEPIWTQLGPSCFKLDPCWPQVGSNLAQVGPMLAPSWLQLGLSWAHAGPISGSPAAPGPTQALPNLIKEATPHPPGQGSRIWSLGRCFLEPCWVFWAPGWGFWKSKRSLPRLQILLPRPGRWGVASLIFTWLTPRGN